MKEPEMEGGGLLDQGKEGLIQSFMPVSEGVRRQILE